MEPPRRFHMRAVALPAVSVMVRSCGPARYFRSSKPPAPSCLAPGETTSELLHASDLRSNQPIHWAAMTRQLNLIDELLQRGAGINARRCDGAQPIHLNNGDYHYRGWNRVPKETAPTPRAVYEHLRARGAFCDICCCGIDQVTAGAGPARRGLLHDGPGRRGGFLRRRAHRRGGPHLREGRGCEPGESVPVEARPAGLSRPHRREPAAVKGVPARVARSGTGSRRAGRGQRSVGRTPRW